MYVSDGHSIIFTYELTASWLVPFTITIAPPYSAVLFVKFELLTVKFEFIDAIAPPSLFMKFDIKLTIVYICY